MQMPELINWQLAKEPYNWLIVGAMVGFFALTVHLFYRAVSTLPPVDI